MTTKRAKAAPTDDELGDLFEGIGDDKAGKKPAPKSKTAKAKADAVEQDILADLESQLGEKAPSSTNTPPPAADAATLSRKSVESTRSYHASFTPSATSSEPQEERKAEPAPAAPAASGGGWGSWGLGSLMSTATAAMKQAEAAVKEIQQNEEAKKWADQVRGNVGALRGLGDELRHRAIPTFTNILHTLAPPISSHERLLIHITHDFVGYPALDPLVHGVFSRVMAQVEGGDLLVFQRGQEATSGHSSAGWHDGPWWRQTDVARDLGLVKGLVEGTKLCRASAEGYSTDYFSANGGIEGARARAVQPLSESNPVRSSDLFLSVQAVTVAEDSTLFAAGATAGKGKDVDTTDMAEEADEMVCFAVFILDPVHDIQFATVSQSMPAKWIRWLDASVSPLTPASGADDGGYDGELERVPDEIREIVEAGGVDPREWVAEWVEEVLNLAVGVVAQRYVARRMGVGEGSLGKGKQKLESVLEDGGSEAARAGLI